MATYGSIEWMDRVVRGPAAEFLTADEICALFLMPPECFDGLVEAGGILPPIWVSKRKQFYTWEHAVYLAIWMRFSPAAAEHRPSVGTGDGRVRAKEPQVYFIRAGEFVKIGTGYDPLKRLADLQCANPLELELVHHVPGTFADERRLHKRFAAYRTRPGGEWFHYSDEIRAFIEGLRSGGSPCGGSC